MKKEIEKQTKLKVSEQIAKLKPPDSMVANLKLLLEQNEEMDPDLLYEILTHAKNDFEKAVQTVIGMKYHK